MPGRRQDGAGQKTGRAGHASSFDIRSQRKLRWGGLHRGYGGLGVSLVPKTPQDSRDHSKGTEVASVGSAEVDAYLLRQREQRVGQSEAF